MRYVSIFAAEPGMVLACEVINSMGKVLLSRQAQLTQSYIDKLIEVGVAAVYIDDELSKGVDIEEPISPVLRAEGLQAVRKKDIDSCKNISKTIVQEILSKGSFSLDMTDLRTYDDYTYAHSVNVAILSCTIGLGLKLNETALEDVVFASLLHDLGKLQVPEEILNKPARLTQEEFALMKTHPRVSYELIEDNIEVSAMVKNAVLCHHENYDGSGYPNGFAADKITDIASIIHVADVYDALVSKRPYKEPYPVYVALEILKGGSGTQFDPKMIDAFLKYVPIYPKGTIVELSDGRKGLVVENSGEHNERPVVRFLDLTEVDLSVQENAELKVTSPSDEDFINIQHLELQREQMKKEIKKLDIWVLDEAGISYQILAKKLSYLYNFKHIKSDTQFLGYVKRYGYPDLVIIDVDKRDINDYETNKQKNKRVSEVVPVIILGSYSDIPTIQMFRESGVMNYILKPFHLLYIQNEIHKLIRKDETE